jgi:hypothetical protein
MTKAIILKILKGINCSYFFKFYKMQNIIYNSCLEEYLITTFQHDNMSVNGQRNRLMSNIQ